MDYLWRPWRMDYVENVENMRDQPCIFCDIPVRENDDLSRLILHRGEHAFIIMNRYPYNTGHLMIAPYSHVGELELLDSETLGEMMNLVVNALRALKKTMNPQGANIGINLGKVAGAGFHEHLHIHVVPRWEGDTNFMPVIAESKVLPEALSDTYRKLSVALQEIL